MTDSAERRPPYWLGIDLGGTNIKIGVVDDAGRALSRLSVPTDPERGPRDGVLRIAEGGRTAVRQAGLTIDQIAGVGVGSPGPMDLKEQILINPHNLPGWVNLPLAKEVGAELKLPAVLQNDANAAAYGEYWVGAGKGTSSFCLYTLGTGVGCGIILWGRILEGEHSHGAEAGHQRIALENPRLNGTGLYGSLEGYASATAVVDRTEELLARYPGSSLNGVQPLTSKVIFEAAARKDSLAERIVDETAFYLAIGAVNLMHIIDPDIVAFAGGMIAAGEPFLNRIRHYVRENALPVPGAKTKIVYAGLGTDAGFIGAAGCARSKFAISPS